MRTSQILDTRDLYKRKCELESLKETLEEAKNDLSRAQEDVRNHESTEPEGALGDEWDKWQADHEELESVVEDAQSALDSAESDFGTDEAEELDELETLESEISDFMHGETMIPEYEFEDYARQTAEDCGDYDSRNEKWPYTCIDWERAARELAMDYSTVTYQGTDYYVRA